GTDGDGVNDAEEGNLFAGFAGGGATMVYLWGGAGTNIVMAGNSFNLAVDGKTTLPGGGTLLHGLSSGATARFGSDFDGVSDAWEANRVYNMTNEDTTLSSKHIDTDFDGGSNGGINPGARLSFRGNITVNNDMVPFGYADGISDRLTTFTNYEAPYMDTTNSDVIPELDPNSSPILKGTFAKGIAPYTNITVDVYQLDPQSWALGQQIAVSLQWAELTDNTTFTNGFAEGAKYVGSFNVPNTGAFAINLAGLDLGSGVVTVTANYSADPAGTHNGRVHTSNFSNPVTLPTLAFVRNADGSLTLIFTGHLYSSSAIGSSSSWTLLPSATSPFTVVPQSSQT